MDSDLFKKIRTIQLRSNKVVDDILAGSYHSIFKGRGIEFEDVREYQPGDDPRRIDWNVTARLGYPYIKSFREERELTVMLLVDISASSRFGSTGKQRHEILAEIGSLLAFSAIKNNDKVGLILFSDIIEYYLPPKKGMRHVMRAIREMLVCRPRDTITDIGKALDFFNKIQKRKGICFLISDFIAPDFSKECAITARKHDLISICLLDPLEKKMEDMGLIRFEDLESRTFRVLDTSREEVRRAVSDWSSDHLLLQNKLMNSIGASFIDIDLSKNYFDAIVKFFKRRSRNVL